MHPFPAFLLFTPSTPRLTRAPSACASRPVRPPESPSQLVQQAARSLDYALTKGDKYVRLDLLPPTLNPLLEQAIPPNPTLLYSLAYSLATESSELSKFPKVSLLFNSAGTAASAQAMIKEAEGGGDEEKDKRITFGSYFRRDSGGVSSFANVIVGPTSGRGEAIMDDLEALLGNEVGKRATWVLVNARLGVDRAAVGMGEMGRRGRFLERFVHAFYFRNLFEIRRPKLIAVERGALLKGYDEVWRVFVLVQGKGYIEGGLFEGKEPDTEEITRLIRTVLARERLQKVKAQGPDVGADAEFLRVVGMCAVATGGVAAALWVAKGGGLLGRMMDLPQ